MKQKFLSYYENYSWFGSYAFLGHALFARSRLRRLSLLNRQKDYLRLSSNPELFLLHRKLNQHLLEQSDNWEDYDYGEGYFYQSLDSIGITGFRDTKARVEAMALKDFLKNKEILEIGCNAGFLSHSVGDVVKSALGFDVNPFQVSIATDVANFLGLKNLDFRESSFEDFDCSKKFDVVISFANHSTHDGRTTQNLEDYFSRCQNLLKIGGALLFESHPPEIEKNGIEKVCSVIGEKFDIEERKVLNYGGFLDQNRTYLKAFRSA